MKIYSAAKIRQKRADGQPAEKASRRKEVAFASDEFGTKAEIVRDEERIPNTRAPYHVMLCLKVDATARVAELAA